MRSITSWGFPITAKIIAGLERCVVIGVGSVGTDMVDVGAATAAGIVVTNTPDIFIEEVADHAMALLLGCARRVIEQHDMVVQNRWFEGPTGAVAFPPAVRHDSGVGQLRQRLAGDDAAGQGASDSTSAAMTPTSPNWR